MKDTFKITPTGAFEIPVGKVTGEMPTRSGTLSVDGLILGNSLFVHPGLLSIDGNQVEVGMQLVSGKTISGTALITSFKENTPKWVISYRRHKAKGKKLLRIVIPPKPKKTYSVSMSLTSKPVFN